MPTSLLLLFAVLTSSSALAADTGTLTFKDRGKDVKTLTVAEVQALVAPESLTTYETHEAKEAKYRAVPLAKLLTAVYGGAWRKAEEVLVTCADGYQPSIPVAKIAAHPAYLAVAREDQSEFTLVNKLQNGEVVPLGPFYMVWDNLKASELRAEGASDQPYQIVGLDLITFATKFPRMGPPAGSTAAVQRGFVAFRKHCMSCHTINGEGGAKGAELNYPVSVTEYMKPKYLTQWISAPTSVRYNTTMPALMPGVKGRDAVLADIVAYLGAMAKKKVEPPKAP